LAEQPLLQMLRITKDFPGVRAVDDVSFEVRSGEVMGLIGENGAGKSTLMNVLCGVHRANSGEVLIDGGPVRLTSPRDAETYGIAMIHQEMSLVDSMSVAENMYLGREFTRGGFLMDYGSQRAAARDVLGELGYTGSVRAAVGSLPVGARQMVEIAKALSLNARVIAMDEPTSALSDTEITRLYEVMRLLRARGVGIIFTSHRFDEVFEITDRVTVLRDGKLVGVVRTAETGHDELIRMMVGRELNQFFTRHQAPGDRVLLRVRDLRLAGEDPSSPARIEGIGFEVAEGEILGLAGLLGAGKTEVLQSVFGAYGTRASGYVEVDGRPAVMRRPADAIARGVALITEDRKGSGVLPEMNVGDNITLASLQALAHFGMLQRRREREMAQARISDLAIRTWGPAQLVRTLSGGNQQKVVLGKWLSTKAKVLLLDEPTRGIDVGAKAEIYRLLAHLSAEGCAMVIASSELPELLNLCDRIMVMREGRVSAVFSRGEATQEKILEAAAPLARIMAGGNANG
jgi:ribose transport system ATP-binding protein